MCKLYFAKIHSKNRNSKKVDRSSEEQAAYFASGCFWSKEFWFDQLYGVIYVRPGFAGGHMSHPSYKKVCQKESGHAECVKVVYDPSLISYTQLLNAFFLFHDFERDRTSNGGQYRSEIFYSTSLEKESIEKQLNELKQLNYKPVTLFSPLQTFWIAEERHRQWYRLRKKKKPQVFKTKLGLSMPLFKHPQ